MGRPTKEFNRQEFENLCKLMCDQKEICAFFETTDKTLTKWCKREYEMSFSECFKEFSAQGRISLRRAQYKSAISKGNVTMQIWLGKQYLGQRDTVEVTDERMNKIDTLIESIDNVAKR